MTRRALLTVLACLPTIAAGCANTTHHAPPAAASRGPTPTGLNQQTGAALFAGAYVRFLDGAGTAAALPDATPAVRALAGQAGSIPAGRRRGTLLLAHLRPAPQPGASYFVAARDQAHTFYAQITLAPKHGRWVVAALTPPDFVQALAPAGPAAAPAPRASGAAQIAVRRFLQGYLSWLYGHAPLPALRDAAPGLLAELKAHPPRIPPAMSSLHATVAAVAMQPHDSGWQALANVTDPRESYELILTLTHTRGRWLISNLSSPR